MTEKKQFDGRRRKYKTRIQVAVVEWKDGGRRRQRSLSLHGKDFGVVMDAIQATVDDLAGEKVEPSPQSLGKTLNNGKKRKS